MVLGGCLLGIIAIFLPPVAVIVRRGCGADLLINILLCILGWIPGVLHAWYIILSYPSLRQRHHHHRRHHSNVYVPPGRRSYGSSEPVVVRRSRSVPRSRSRGPMGSVGRVEYGAPPRSSAPAVYREEVVYDNRGPAYHPPPKVRY